MTSTAARACLCAAALLLSGCPPEPPAPDHSYVAVGYYSDQGGAETPCVWTNDGVTALPLGATGLNGRATSLALSGSSILVGGYLTTAAQEVPCFWLDGTLHLLAGAAGWQSGRVTAVAFSGSDAICGGQYTAASADSIPAVWKNGALLSSLSGGPGSTSASITGIALSGGAIAASGSYIDGGATPVLTRPCRWTNDSVTVLAGGTGWVNAYATAIAASGGSLAAAGYYFTGAPSSVACYWTGTTVVPLSAGPGATDSKASAVAIIDGDVVVAGERFAGSRWVPCIWSSTSPTDLEVGGDCRGGLVYSLAGVAGHLAAAGCCIDASSNVLPAVWLDGVAQDVVVPSGAVTGVAAAVALH